ncbi:MAG: chemotaxis protein CheD [Nitrospinae bacterium]|nr:chemotaxis protein CheD [Nitrospinota bacterium]
MNKEIVLQPGRCIADKTPTDDIVIHSVGVGIALLLYDEKNRVGGAGLFTISMPPQDTSKADTFPGAGLPNLLKKMKELGADTASLSVKMIGGADLHNAPTILSFGRKNRDATVAALKEVGLTLAKEDTGGSHKRSVKFSIGTGKVALQTVTY